MRAYDKAGHVRSSYVAYTLLWERFRKLSSATSRQHEKMYIKVTRVLWKWAAVATRFGSSEINCSNPVQSFTLHTVDTSHVHCCFSRMYNRHYLQPRSSKQLQITCQLMMSCYLGELGHKQTLSCLSVCAGGLECVCFVRKHRLQVYKRAVAAVPTDCGPF